MFFAWSSAWIVPIVTGFQCCSMFKWNEGCKRIRVVTIAWLEGKVDEAIKLYSEYVCFIAFGVRLGNVKYRERTVVVWEREMY